MVYASTAAGERNGRRIRPTDMHRLRLSAAVALLALLGAAGCTDDTPDPVNSGDPSASASTPPTAAASPAPTAPAPGSGDPAITIPPPAADEIQLVRTGGLAGVSQIITVRPDGAWTSTGKGTQTGDGRLTAADLTELRTLADRLPDQGALAIGGQCADAFTYTLTAAGEVYVFTDCPTAPQAPEAAGKIAELLVRATG